MKVPPHDPIYRAESVADAAKFDWEQRLLIETVNLGATIVSAIPANRTLGHTEACITALAAQCVAMADAIQILVSAGSVSAARLQARTLFETEIYLHWILSERTEERALCWWAHTKADERESIARQLATTTEGREFASLWQRAGMPLSAVLDDPQRQAKLAEQLARLDEGANKARWAGKKKAKHWYQSAGGQNLRQLAANVSQEHLYVFFYRLFCRDVHSANPDRWIQIRNSAGSIKAIRTMDGHAMLLQFTLSMLFPMYEVLIDHFAQQLQGDYAALRSRWGPVLSRIRDAVYNEETPQHTVGGQPGLPA
jgi:hypothetical protein